LRTCILLCALLLPWSLQAQGLATVIWEPSTDPNTAGYIVYVGVTPGVHMQGRDVGRQLSFPLFLEDAAPRYVTVASYSYNPNGTKNIGPKAPELIAQVSGTPPPPPETCGPDGLGNGVDEDKDGQVDEICLPPPPQETCAPDGTGNGVDEDRDGLIDEICLPPPPSDTLAPVVNSLRATRNGNSSNFSVLATASDNVGVAYVDFYVGTVFRARLEVAPYQVTLKIQQAGLHVIEARAFDAAGNTSSAHVTVKR